SVDNAGTATFDGFRVAAPIAVLGFEPALTSPGATVVIRGTGFAADAARNRVYLNSLRLSVTKASPTELTVSLPARATTGAVLVDVVRGGRAQSTSELRVEEPPVITAVDPDGAIPGASITLRGKHFGDDLREVHVRLGEQELKVRTVAPTEIVADIPQGAVSGVLEVQVATLAPARALRPFEVRVPVTVGVFHPTSGPAGTRVALQGGGFSKAAAQNRVVLGSTPVRVVTANAQQLILEIPERAMTGVLKVAVPGAGSASTAQPFVVTVPPILGAFDPVEGPPGTDVTLRGAHFGTNPALVEVTLSGTKLEIAKLTDGIIVVRVPDAAQTGKFSVRVAAQGSVVSGAAFRVTAPPAAGLNLTSIEPVCQKAGCEVALKGTGFAAKAENNHVFFGSTELKVTSATANVLKVRLPELLGSDVFRVAVDDAGEVSSAPFEIVK
ncbi:MAG: IPT/TIG domain-containing protein, partial [Polyangiales bacterium]